MEQEPGASEEISFEITPEMMELVNNEGERILERRDFKIYIGGSSPGKSNEELGIDKLQEATFTLR